MIDKEELKKLLKENLKIKINHGYSWGDDSCYLEVAAYFDNELISEDSILTD